MDWASGPPWLRKYPTTRAQRCRVHKTASVLDKFPKTPPPPAKDKIHPSYLAPTQAAALKSFDAFISLDDAQYPKACECLRKEAGGLFTFHDFPAAHWQPLRTTNPIESAFATVRRRTEPTKGRGSRKATLTMVWPLARAAAKEWRRLNGSELISKAIEGVVFLGGEEKKTRSRVQ